MKKWRDLGINELYASRLDAMGYTEATPIQEESIPKILEGESVLGLARTGTGKTLAYLLPLFSRHFPDGQTNPDKQVLIMVPTRELAVQVSQSISEFGLNNSVIIGGEREDAQLRSVSKSSFLVCTPGRLLDLKQRGKINFKKLLAVIFDEGDRLLDMGFEEDIRKLFRGENISEKQVLLYSATIHNGVEILLHEFGVSFERVQVSSDQLTVENLDQKIAYISEEEKFHALCHLLHQHKEANQVVIFSNYKDKALRLSKRLNGMGAGVNCLTSQLSQSGRKNILTDFKSGKLKYLIASDLAARGLDVDALDLVVNYDLPEDPAVYVHRVGRTARAGKKGLAVSFAGFEDSFRIEKLKKYLKQNIDVIYFEDEQLKGVIPRFGPMKDREESLRMNRESKPDHKNKRDSQSSQRKRKTRKTHEKSSERAKHSKKRETSRPLAQKTPSKGVFAKLWKKVLGLFITLPEEEKKNSSPYRKRRRSHSKNYRKNKQETSGQASRPRKKHSSKRHSYNNRKRPPRSGGTKKSAPAASPKKDS